MNKNLGKRLRSFHEGEESGGEGETFKCGAKKERIKAFYQISWKSNLTEMKSSNFQVSQKE